MNGTSAIQSKPVQDRNLTAQMNYGDCPPAGRHPFGVVLVSMYLYLVQTFVVKYDHQTRALQMKHFLLFLAFGTICLSIQ